MSSGQPAGPSSSAGFTLVELMITTVIIGIIAFMTIPLYRSLRDKAKITAAMVELRELEKAVNAFSIDNAGRYPSTLADVGLGGRLDPWQNSYQYFNIVNDHVAPRMGVFEALNSDFDLYSLGADGATGDESSDDDIVRSGDGSFIGLGKDLR